MSKYTKIAVILFFVLLMTSLITGESEAWPRHRVYVYQRPVRVVRVVRPYHYRTVWVRGHYRINGYGFLVWVPGYRARV